MIFRYLLRGHMGMTLRVLAFILLAISLGQFIDAFQAVGSDGKTLPVLMLAWTAILRTPALLQYALPHVIIIGTVLYLHRMGTRREFAIMAGVGRNAWHLLSPLAVSAFLIGCAYVFVLSPVSAVTLAEVDDIRAQQLPGTVPGKTRNIAVRHGTGTLYVFTDAISADGDTIDGLTMIEVTGTHAFDRRIDIDTATRGADGRWQITGYRVATGAGAPREEPPPADLPFDAEDLLRPLPDRQAIAIYNLPGTAAFAESIAAQPLPYRFQFHWLLAMPFFLSAVALLTGALGLHLAFHRSWARRALEVLALAFPVYTMVTVIEALAIRGILPTLTAAVVGPVVLSLLALIMARVRRV